MIHVLVVVEKSTRSVVESSMKNTVTRVIAANNSIRAFFAYTTNMVETARRMHNLNPVSTAALGRLLTASSIMGLMNKSENDKLSIIVQGDGPMAGMCTTADSKGVVKGYVYNNDFIGNARIDGHLDVGGAIGYGTLTVIRDLGLTHPYNSSIPLITGEIGDDLTYYFANSEQTPSSVGLGVLMDKNTAKVSQAGGFIVQGLPKVSDEILDKLEDNIKKISSVTDILSKNNSVTDLIESVLSGFDYEITDVLPVDFHCDCSKSGYIEKLKTLPKSQLEDIFKDTDVVELNCNMCSLKYNIKRCEVIN